MAEAQRPLQVRHGAWEWQMQAACRGTDTAVFFHPENERGPSRRQREARAKALCRHCPVVTACLQAALATREPYGVWGGLSTDERAALLIPQPA
jgi:WhiB family transcriptional regulator, redox-sensing transcriptional regulator